MCIITLINLFSKTTYELFINDIKAINIIYWYMGPTNSQLLLPTKAATTTYMEKTNKLCTCFIHSGNTKPTRQHKYGRPLSGNKQNQLKASKGRPVTLAPVDVKDQTQHSAGTEGDREKRPQTTTKANRAQPMPTINMIPATPQQMTERKLLPSAQPTYNRQSRGCYHWLEGKYHHSPKRLKLTQQDRLFFTRGQPPAKTNNIHHTESRGGHVKPGIYQRTN